MAPTISQYNMRLSELEAQGLITLEEHIILRLTYQRTAMGLPVNRQYLSHITGLPWKELCWTLNGLVLRGALETPEKGWYLTKL